MNRRNTNQFAIFVSSIACLGLVAESYMLGWEFWVPPLLVLGVIGCWVLHITETGSENMREVAYFAFVCIAVLFHGVHVTSFFDVAVVIMLVFVTFAPMNRRIFMRILLPEYLVIVIIQIIMAVGQKTVVFDSLNISRLFMHFIAVLFVYLTCVRNINVRLNMMEQNLDNVKKIEAYDEDMEDFLANISHELRTPVNVVNGMSDLMIKRNAGEEALSIKDAGIRLSYQIGDIQDYTETKRNKLILEEEEYTSTSLINDVVMIFRGEKDSKGLELVVDLSPNVPAKMKGDIKKLHKIFRHLLENAIRFTKEGGIYVSLSTEETSCGTNLCIEVIDTGIGMERETIALAGDNMYQKDKKRDRSSGGIGLGLSLVYGFAHRMGGFVRIESEIGAGTTVRVTIPQKVVDKTPCLKFDREKCGDIMLHVHFGKYKVARVREFYRNMIVKLSSQMGVPLYLADTVSDVQRMMSEQKFSYIFMGEQEYWENASYFDAMSGKGTGIVVSAEEGFTPNSGSHVLFMSKPLYAYPVVRILNGDLEEDPDGTDLTDHPYLNGVRALVVDDEYMNLVVATGLFRDYGMVVDTAGGGRESVEKFRENDYDIIFMDHMMPEMDGVEAVRRIREVSKEQNKRVKIVALTANVASGARELFVREGFDGFIAKPINLTDFERVMVRLFMDHDRVPEV